MCVLLFSTLQFSVLIVSVLEEVIAVFTCTTSTATGS